MAPQELTSRPAERLFHDLVDAVTDYAIFFLDQDGQIASWNPGAARLKGYSASEAIGHHFSIFYTNEDRAAGKPARILDIVRADGRYEEEGWRVRKDGTKFWANAVLTVVKDAAGNARGFAKVTRDLTARREAEHMQRTLLLEQQARLAAEQNQKELEESRRSAEAAARRAEESNRIKDEFLATVSHELRTPLNAILGWASLLRSRAENTPYHAGLDAICRNAQAQAHIIEDLLDVSRIITGKLKLVFEPMDLLPVVKEALAVVEPSARAKGISLRLLCDEPVALLVGDTERLRQVAWNLLSNAVKFTDAGGKVEVSVGRNADGHVTLSVADTGKGIDPQFLPYVFDRFRQGESTTTRRYGGLGLGLSLVRHIVELHGGQAMVQSEGPGRGATFSLSFPIHALSVASADDSAAVPPSDAALPASATRLDGIRVVVVDDDDDTRELLKTLLTSAGAVVESAGSAEMALRAFHDFRPQIVLSDLAMPEEDGFSLARRVRELELSQGRRTPLIALSALSRTQDNARALEAGFNAHLAKPVAPEQLMRTVREWAAKTADAATPS